MGAHYARDSDVWPGGALSRVGSSPHIRDCSRRSRFSGVAPALAGCASAMRKGDAHRQCAWVMRIACAPEASAARGLPHPTRQTPVGLALSSRWGSLGHAQGAYPVGSLCRRCVSAEHKMLGIAILGSKREASKKLAKATANNAVSLCRVYRKVT